MEKPPITALIKPFPLPASVSDVSLAYIQKTLDFYKSEYDFDLTPDFHRNHCWSKIQQISYVESLLRRITVTDGATIVFNSPSFAGNEQEPHSDIPDMVLVLDGLQKLNAILAYLNGDFKVFDDLGGFTWEDLEGTELSSDKISVSFQMMRLQTKKELLEYYALRNKPNTAHSAENIAQVEKIVKALG